MYAGLWKHCMVILSFIFFIVLISAVEGGVLYLIWSQSIVFGVINLWEVLRLTSQLLPPSTFFYGTRSSLSSSVSTDNTTATTKTTKENKRRGEKQPTELFAWLVILQQTQGPNDYWPRPLDLPKQQDVGPFSLCCCWLFSFSRLHPSLKRWRGQPIPQHLGSTSEKTSTLLHGPNSNHALGKALLHVTYIRIHMHKDPTSSISQSFLLPTILGNTMMLTFTSIQTHTNEIQHPSTYLPIDWFIFFP